MRRAFLITAALNSERYDSEQLIHFNAMPDRDELELVLQGPSDVHFSFLWGQRKELADVFDRRIESLESRACNGSIKMTGEGEEFTLLADNVDEGDGARAFVSQEEASAIARELRKLEDEHLSEGSKHVWINKDSNKWGGWRVVPSDE